MRRFGLVGRVPVTRTVQVLAVVALVAAGLSFPSTPVASLPTDAFEISDANIEDSTAAGSDEPDWGALFTSTGAANVVAGVDATSFTTDRMSADTPMPVPPCAAGNHG